ncbi:MAG TPA: isochorismatase family protein [Rhodopseudomonas sp.]|uniref:isochorismatase family protein n=1 Tax=Rhodopseudomonas sp. TaxID=1078 RepID=UPI002EDB848B
MSDAIDRRPSTLLGFAGAPTQPASFAEAALVLIDYQAEYLTGSLKLPDGASALVEAQRLLAAARAAGAPVFHVVHHGRPGGRLFDPDGPYVAIAAPLAPLAGETVIAKPLPNSFAQTDLQAAIARSGRKQLIIAGFMTHLCVSATTRAALDLGYRSTVVAEACASRDLPDPLSGGVVAAGEVHRATLAALADRFAIVVRKTDQLAVG